MHTGLDSRCLGVGGRVPPAWRHLSVHSFETHRCCYGCSYVYSCSRSNSNAFEEIITLCDVSAPVAYLRQAGLARHGTACRRLQGTHSFWWGRG